MSDAAVLEPELKDLGDKIANLTLKQAKSLSDLLVTGPETFMVRI